jgi:hypothetical protein
MPVPQALTVICTTCKVASTCPKKGSSPLKLPNGKQLMCKILGGYGRKPLEPKVMSKETRELAEKDGPCLTIAEVPALDPASGLVYYDTVKIMSQPILHPREKVSFRTEMMYPQSCKRGRPRHNQ